MQVPYVNSAKTIKPGVLISDLNLHLDATVTPKDHVVHFAGEYPCNKDGTEIAQIRYQSVQRQLDTGLVIQHSFSNKPAAGYKDYYEKMTNYAAIISNPAQAIDPTVTPKTFPLIPAEDDESPFNYFDTASSRAEIIAVTRKLELAKVAIVGLGGTGSYVLDLVAKTPVREIHLFDGDLFLQHNAFRSPGALSTDELGRAGKKVAYFQSLYSKIHRNIVANAIYLDASNVDLLQGMDFVFLCLDRGDAKRQIVEKLEPLGIPFIDVGMGLELVDTTLYGVLRITTSTKDKRDHVRTKNRIPFTNGPGNDDYSRNIQVADLNALNAALAVIKWKKLMGFYGDYGKEYNSTYTIDGNALYNEDTCETAAAAKA